MSKRGIVELMSAMVATAVAAGMNPAAESGVLARFHAENDGKSLRRLPSWIVPENAFLCLRKAQMDDSANAVHRRIFALYRDRSDWNVLTYCARFADHDDPGAMARVAEAAKAMREAGIEFLMENDPRLMRDGFFGQFPADFLRMRQFAVAEPDADGTARFEVKMESLADYGGRVQYAFWRPGRIVALRVVAGDRMRLVSAEESICDERCASGVVRGLVPGERLLVEVEWPLHEIDPASPNLLEYARRMMLRYRDLGVAGLMRDEFTFRKAGCDSIQEHRAFWHSPHFAAAYSRRSGGRSLDDDLPLLALGVDSPLAHAAASDYTLTIYDVIKAMEEDFHAANKEYFGRDVHVAKHTTWITAVCPWEFFGNGLVWWAAPRDWSQSDECNSVPVSTGMMKKFGTPLWLNEGYGPNPDHYVKTLWRYVPCGGRMVYHTIFDWDGFLRVGQQRYLAFILHRLSPRERAKWDALVNGRDIKTRVFVDPGIGEVARFLDEVHAVRQTPLGPDGMGGSKDNRLPPPDGLMFLVDGTAVRVKGSSPDFASDPIAGELETNGCRVRYAARGLFAARCENGVLTTFAGGEVTRVEGPGLSLMLDEPADIALSKIDGEWRGVWQTPDSSAPIPSPLLSITPHWVRLRGLAANRSISRFPDRLPDGGFPKPINHNPKRSNQE